MSRLRENRRRINPLIIDARVVCELGILEVYLDNALGDLEINDEATDFHRPRSRASAIAISETGPPQRLVHPVFKCVPHVQALGGPHALNRVFDQQYGMVIDFDGLKAFPKWLSEYLLQVLLFAEFLVPFVFGGFATLTDNTPVLGDLGAVGPGFVVMQCPLDAFVEF